MKATWRVNITSGMKVKKTNLECLREHSPDLLLGEGSSALGDFVALTPPLLLPSPSTGTDGAPQNLGSPPAVDGTLSVVKPHYRVGVCQRPRMWRLGQPRDDVERSEGQVGGIGMGDNGGDVAQGTRRDDGIAGGCWNGLHAASVTNTKYAGGLVWAIR